MFKYKQISNLCRLVAHTGVGDPGGAGTAPAAVGQHVRAGRLSSGVPTAGIRRAAIFPYTQVTHM